MYCKYKGLETFKTSSKSKQIQQPYLWIQCLQTRWSGPLPAEVHVYRSRRLSLAGTWLAEQHQEPLAPCGASLLLRPLQALLLNEGSSSCCANRGGWLKQWRKNVNYVLHSIKSHWVWEFFLSNELAWKKPRHAPLYVSHKDSDEVKNVLQTLCRSLQNIVCKSPHEDEKISQVLCKKLWQTKDTQSETCNLIIESYQWIT